MNVLRRLYVDLAARFDTSHHTHLTIILSS